MHCNKTCSTLLTLVTLGAFEVDGHASSFFSLSGGASFDHINREVAKLPAAQTPERRPVTRGVVATVRGSRLNVRSRPSAMSRVRASLNDGTPVRVYARSRSGNGRSGWVAISPARDRWVHSGFVRAAQ